MTAVATEPIQYRFKTKPYKHQVQALKKLLANGYGGALLMEPRTGKTKVAIDYMGTQSLKHGIRKWVVVCPRRVMHVWRDELAIHSPLRVQAIMWDRDYRKTRSLPSDSSLTGLDLVVVIVNYEAFQVGGRKTPSGRRSKTTGRYKTREQLLKWVGYPWPHQTPRVGYEIQAGMILDESHRIKSPSGKSSSMIVGVGQAFVRRVILTGTPVTKASRAHDIWMQWKFLNRHRFPEFSTHGEFKNYYGKWIQVAGYEKWIKALNESDLHRRIHRDAFSVTRQECFDMPPPTPRTITFPLTTSGKTYDEMAEEMIARLRSGETITAFNAAVQSLRLAQIAAGVATTSDKKLIRIGREKLEALSELLEESLEHEEKVVVACRFRADIVSVMKDAEDLGFPLVLRLDGTVKPEQTALDLATFKAHDGAAVYVIQPQAGGVGIDLSTAGRFIWYTLTTSWVDYRQCSDRVALNPACDIVHLIAQSTVDQIYLDILNRDGDVGAAVLRRPEALRRT